MNYGLLFRTVIHLKPTQVFYQVMNRLIKHSYIAMEAPNVDSSFKFQVPRLNTDPIPKFKCVDGETFTFLNLEHEFAGWNFTGNGMLWAFNQNYFDWINEDGFPEEEGNKWIDLFIRELSQNKVGLEPYPIALRCVNWVKFFCRYPESATKQRLDALYSQLVLLEKRLEYHLLGNHLLEDAYSLYFGASFLKDEGRLKRAEKLLVDQLKEQILPDGANYEQSPMYHCILLDRLLDCINIRRTQSLVLYAQQMLGHLESILWGDGTISMLNDSANGIAPLPNQLFEYASRLGLQWSPKVLKECGYRKINRDSLEAIVDIGNITASYQPSHTHADTFSYELRIDGKPIVVDTGISTYNKTERRQYERSTKAHNTVSVGGKDSSEVWAGFRVARQCQVNVHCDEENHIEASHNGFEKPCKRSFKVEQDSFIVEDHYDGEAVSYIHLAPGVNPQRVKIEGSTQVDVVDTQYSTEYNKFIDNKTVVIHFKGSCRYSIS